MPLLFMFIRNVILILLFSFGLAKAQTNLVPNWSFENIDSCPTSPAHLNVASPWFQAHNSAIVSSDLYNECDTNYMGIPFNLEGFQYTNSGIGYAGIFPYYDDGTSNSYREYIEVKLSNSLEFNKTYCISFYASLANMENYGIRNLAVAITSDSLNIPSFSNLLINYTPQIESSIIITDTMNWFEVKGSYTATGNENFITIGNFKDNANTIVSPYLNNNPSSPPTTLSSYYYIDDVSVVEISPAGAGNDTAMCSGEVITIGGLPTFGATYNWYAIDGSGNVSIDSMDIAKPHVSPIVTTTYVMQKTQCSAVTYDTVVVTVNCVGIEQYAFNDFKGLVYPNPNDGKMNVEIILNEGEQGVLSIHSIEGKLIVDYKLTSGENKLDIQQEQLSAGVYFYKLYVNKQHIKTRKIIIVK